MKRTTSLLDVLLFLLSFTLQLPGQSFYGTFTGIVSDPSNAVIANANIKLHDQQSGVVRETVTNSEGYYTFASVPPGVYEIIVSSAGFETHSQTGVALGGGDKLNVNIALKVANTANTVVVSGSADLITPVDSGEK